MRDLDPLRSSRVVATAPRERAGARRRGCVAADGGRLVGDAIGQRGRGSMASRAGRDAARRRW